MAGVSIYFLNGPFTHGSLRYDIFLVTLRGEAKSSIRSQSFLSAAAIVAAISLSTPAMSRTLQERIDAFNRCSANGGDTAVCCVAASGELTIGGQTYTTESGHRVTIGSSCLITAEANDPSPKKKVLIAKTTKGVFVMK